MFSKIIIESSGKIEKFIEPVSGRTLVIVVRSEFSGDKYNFITPDEFPLQLGFNRYKKGERIQPHSHRDQRVTIESFQECVFIKKGEVTLFIYDDNHNFLHAVDLKEGDTVFKASGGHGYKVNEDTEILEVKQGPYSGESDKHRFDFGTELQET